MNISDLEFCTAYVDYCSLYGKSIPFYTFCLAYYRVMLCLNKLGVKTNE